MAYTAIDDPEAYFQAKLYTGTGSQLAVTLDGDTDMQPDFVWFKNRGTTNSHGLQDSARGFDTTGIQSTNGSDADPAFDGSTLGYVSAVGSDGFTVEAGNCANASSNNYVAWCWKESATAGFDIDSNSGTGSARTEAHSLSAVPHVIIMKSTNDSTNWVVYHHKNTSAPETDWLRLNDTRATSDDSARWNDTAPTSSVFSVGTDSETNASGNSYISYLWSEKQGFSKFGGYTGNGGNIFIYTGFRPAWIMCKQTSGTANWQIYNNKVSPFNQGSGEYTLRANASTAEGSAGTYEVDLLSNGFRPVGGSSSFNTSGQSYVYMAFAEAPFVNSNGVPCNAR